MEEAAKVDLHLHTTASDGTWGPEKLVSKIKNAGIKLFTVTDHDSTENLGEIARLAKNSGIGFIRGVEINTSFKQHNYHLLGLGIDPTKPELQMLLDNNRRLMEEKDDQAVQYLEGIYPAVSFSEYKAYDNNRERGGWKALNYLIDKRLCHSYKDFFQLFTKWGNPFEKMTFVSPSEAIAAINKAGGVSILAHPGASFYDRDYQSLIKFMIHEGIQGIECYHPENSLEISEYCLEICRSNHLLVSGGSDCHGDFIAERSLGVPDIRLSQLEIEVISIEPGNC